MASRDFDFETALDCSTFLRCILTLVTCHQLHNFAADLCIKINAAISASLSFHPTKEASEKGGRNRTIARTVRFYGRFIIRISNIRPGLMRADRGMRSLFSWFTRYTQFCFRMPGSRRRIYYRRIEIVYIPKKSIFNRRYRLLNNRPHENSC